ncbi:MAG TPA: hypothetical protein VGX95_07925 [Xanthobacteraceae bacterium]|nr:hypothetical protein [Xanthobacteraceae bacterium]
MLVFGAASQAWETLSALQPANASAAAAGIGVEPFVTDTTSPTAAAADPVQSVPPPTGTIGQASLSPDVLGFLIWNQSQQPGAAPSATGSTNAATAGANGSTDAPTTGTGGGADTSGITAWPPFQSWFPPFSSDGTAAVSSAPNAASGGNGSTSPTVTWPSQSTTDPALATGESGPAPESSGAHGHHHHHAGFAVPSLSDQSDPLANLLGVAAQGASSTTAANADGSTTTTITYADGSEVTLTSAPQASSSNPGPTAAAAQLPINSNSFLATLIQLQARLLAPSAAA